MFGKIAALLSTTAVIYNGSPMVWASEDSASAVMPDPEKPDMGFLKVGDFSKMLPNILQGLDTVNIGGEAGTVVKRVMKTLSDPKMVDVMKTLSENPEIPTQDILEMLPNVDQEVLVVMVNTVRSLSAAMKDEGIRGEIEGLITKGVKDVSEGKDKSKILQDILSSDVFSELKDEIVDKIDQEPEEVAQAFQSNTDGGSTTDESD